MRTNVRPAELHHHKGENEVEGDTLDELDDLLLVGHLARLNFIFVEELWPLIIIKESEENVAQHEARKGGREGSWKSVFCCPTIWFGLKCGFTG